MDGVPRGWPAIKVGVGPSIFLSARIGDADLLQVDFGLGYGSVMIHHPSYMLMQFLSLNSGIFGGYFHAQTPFTSLLLCYLSSQTQAVDPWSFSLLLGWPKHWSSKIFEIFDYFLMEELQKDMC